MPLTSIRMAKSLKLKIPSAGKDAEQAKLSYSASGDAKWYSSSGQ